MTAEKCERNLISRGHAGCIDINYFDIIVLVTHEMSWWNVELLSLQAIPWRQISSKIIWLIIARLTAIILTL